MNFNTLKNIFWTLKKWRKRNFTAPSPEFVKHQIIKNNNLDNCLWIETGTYYGETTKMLSNISKKTVSIEVDENLYNLAKRKLSNLSNVEIFFGRSEEILPNIIKSNLNFDNVCIYLDAHICHDHLKDKKTFGNEEEGTPIKIELDHIQKYLKNFKKINILIDDIRLFNNNFQNYPNKNFLVDWCIKNDLDWEIEHDIFIIKKN